MKLILFAVYIGIGAMLHALFVGPNFDWSSAWTLGWLFGWPIMLVISTGAALVAGAVICGLVAAGWSWLETIADWRERRRIAK